MYVHVIYFNCVYEYLCVYVHVIFGCLWRSEEVVGSPVPGFTASFEPPDNGCWEFNLSPLQEQCSLSLSILSSPKSFMV